MNVQFRRILLAAMAWLGLELRICMQAIPLAATSVIPSEVEESANYSLQKY